ncbi:MAG: histidine kinase, partial [Nocardioides sp.]
MSPPRNGAASAVGRPYLAGMWAAVHLIADLPSAIGGLILGTFVLVGVATIPALGLGVLILLPTLPACRWLLEFDRRRVDALLGVALPAATLPHRAGWRGELFSAASWTAAGYAWLGGLWGVFVSSTVVSLATTAIVLMLVPVFAADEGFRLIGLFDLASAPSWMAFVGFVLLAVTPALALALSRVNVQLVRWGCGHPSERTIARLESRVESLRTTRDDVVDSVEAERRRIERDLHDGPQQRLVAIAMELGMAREAIESDPDRARELIERAHAASKDAVTEMRQVARGIAPPVLTDRGLDAALSALAARSPVPVASDIRLPERPDATIEAIAYFCVSECLTNVAKHSGASRAQVLIARSASGPLLVRVSDDGAGGADPAGG